MPTKLLLSLGLLFLAGAVTAQQKSFTLSGSIKGKTGTYIYISYPDEAQKDVYKTDSAFIQNGRFSIKGVLNAPVQATVYLDKRASSPDQYAQLFIVPGNMQLTLDYNRIRESAVLKGSPIQAEADRLEKAKAPVYAQLKPFSQAYDQASATYREAIKAKKDEVTLEALKAEATKAKDAMDPYYEELRKMDMAFMDRYPSSQVTASLLRWRVNSMPLEEGVARYNKLSDAVKNSSTGKNIKKELDELRGGSPGAKAFVFSSTELRGTPLSLSDFKGKYVLVDFWASWCVPCRKGNPHLLAQYAKYKDKGLEIIGVSDDDGKPEAWKKAVEQDGIGVWKHVLRGLKRTPEGGFDKSGDISEPYGISSLPTKILIDPNGVIIGRYGGGGEDDAAMDKKLAEVFGQ